MILNSKQILEKCNYYISYIFQPKKNEAHIFVSWKNITYIIKWDKNYFSSSYDDKIVSCPDYAAESLAYIILCDICKNNGYHIKFINYFVENNSVNRIYFDIDGMDIQKKSDLLLLSKDINDNGLKPNHIDLAIDGQIWDGLKAILEYKFNLKCYDFNRLPKTENK